MPKKTKPAKVKAKPTPKPKAKAKARAKAKAKAVKATAKAHPSYGLLLSKLSPGRHAGGMLFVTKPGALDREMAAWLMGHTEGRKAIGRTAFGDIVVFRDLRAKAKELGMPNAERACDVALIDIHYKRMSMLGLSVEEFLESLDDPKWQRAFLRADLYKKAKKRLGDYRDDECFYFVPALALGRSEEPTSVDRGKWDVQQSILLQT